MSVAFRSCAASTLFKASGCAERDGGARRRVRDSCLVGMVAEGMSKSGVLSIVTEGAMVAMLCVQAVFREKRQGSRTCRDWCLVLGD